MYSRHYGLTAKPFSIVPDPNILHLSKNHENALTYLEYGLSEKVGFILLTGEVGIGKTTLIRHMVNSISSQVDVAVIFNTNLSSDQMFRRILSEFDLPCEATDKSLHLETLYHFLIEQYAQGRHTLLIIDEAQNLSDDVLEDIRMLFNLQTDNHFLLQVILVGQTDLKQRLSAPNLRQLAQRIVVNYHLCPLDDEQTYQYIDYRLKAAGATTELFSPEAMALIHEKSAGIPRTINLLCDAGLVYGYAENKTHVDRRIIENVLKDRICLTAATQPPQAPPVADAKLEEPATAWIERIVSIEAALADLQYAQDKFRIEIRSELDQALGAPKTAPLDGDHSHQAENNIDDQLHAFTFRDSAVAHSLEFENECYPSEAEAPDPAYRFDAVHSSSKPDPLTFLRKEIVPYLDLAYTWARRTLSHRHALWIVILLVPLAGLWAMLGGEETPSKRYADQAIESAPPPELVSMHYDDTPPAQEATPPASKATATDPGRRKAAKIHTVQSGETLLSIARHYGVSAKLIKKANKLGDSHLIYAGQPLKIPSPPPDDVSKLEVK